MKLFNFLTRKIEVFKPAKGKTARIYACGPTVYNFAHIGNLRTYIFEDLMCRAIEQAGFKVKLVMNITDVEDKIIRDAKKAGKNIFEFVKPYERAFFDDLKLLNINPAFKYPKATAHIKEMVGLINKLLKKGLAYESGGSIYFDISRFKNYGRLSRLNSFAPISFLTPVSHSRIDADEYAKDDAQDFVLWKKSKPGLSRAKSRGEPSWSAKFQLGGATAKLAGRPGWHIECSAMSIKYLGQTLDIHSGGIDLLFPHHENEIAQSEGATGKKFARFFVEGEHLMVDGKKMSKSLGNLYTLRDLRKRDFNPLAFRYLALTSHYRSKLNFTWESLQAAQNALAKIRNRVIELKQKNAKVSPLHQFRKQFKKHIFNDLDTPKALAVFWKNFDRISLADILWANEFLGLNLKSLKSASAPPAVKKLVEERERARREKNWRAADQIREKVRNLGWQIEDSSAGPTTKRS